MKKQNEGFMDWLRQKPRGYSQLPPWAQRAYDALDPQQQQHVMQVVSTGTMTLDQAIQDQMLYKRKMRQFTPGTTTYGGSQPVPDHDPKYGDLRTGKLGAKDMTNRVLGYETAFTRFVNTKDPMLIEALAQVI